MLSGKVLVAISVLVTAAATITSALAGPDLPGIDRELTLKSHAETWSQSICLGDLVEDSWVQGRCAVDHALCCQWSMGGARAHELKRADIQRVVSKLNFSGFNLKITGPEQVAVTQTHRMLTDAEIRSKIEAAATAKLGDENSRATVTALQTRSPIYVPLAAESSWDVVLPEQPTSRATIKVISTTAQSQTLGWAQASLKLESDVYVAKKTLHPNDALLPEDFEVRKADVLAAQSAGQMVYRKGQFPEATRARRTIRAGAPLVTAAVERIPSVRLGDSVTLILRSDNLRISTKAVVQGSAAVGDMVTVQLSRYNRTFRGRLVEGRTVEVWL